MHMVGFKNLHVVQFQHCPGEKIRDKGLPNFVGGVDFAEFCSVKGYMVS
jgi:hypothetical protein